MKIHIWQKDEGAALNLISQCTLVSVSPDSTLDDFAVIAKSSALINYQGCGFHAGHFPPFLI
jgi:hypothetical protein